MKFVQGRPSMVVVMLGHFGHAGLAQIFPASLAGGIPFRLRKDRTLKEMKLPTGFEQFKGPPNQPGKVRKIGADPKRDDEVKAVYRKNILENISEDPGKPLPVSEDPRCLCQLGAVHVETGHTAARNRGQARRQPAVTATEVQNVERFPFGSYQTKQPFEASSTNPPFVTVGKPLRSPR